jgi:hypothetical protein
MEVKGTAVRSTPLFVRKQFGQRFDEWIGSLSDKSAEIMKSKVETDLWYPLQEAFVEPTSNICDLFYGGDQRGAWELGRFSADYALWGLYRLFVRIGSPGYMIKRASTIFSTYYRPSQMIATETHYKSAVIHITLFPEPEELVELRIGGWMERALEISGCSGVQMKITRSLTRGDDLTEFVGEWR